MKEKNQEILDDMVKEKNEEKKLMISGGMVAFTLRLDPPLMHIPGTSIMFARIGWA